MAHYDDILSSARQYVTRCFENCHDERLAYHNFSHTRDVVNAVRLIGEKETLTEHEQFLAEISAWFHDMGYFFSKENHEKEGVKKAENFLKQQGLTEEEIRTVREAILATMVPQKPVSTVGKVLCDADLSTLADPDLLSNTGKLMAERNLLNGTSLSLHEFLFTTLKFMEGHTYFTEYGRTVLEKGKSKNMDKVRKMISRS